MSVTEATLDRMSTMYELLEMYHRARQIKAALLNVAESKALCRDPETLYELETIEDRLSVSRA